MKKNKTLILGGTGFIGLNLIDRICKSGGKVRVLCRPSYSLGRLEPYRNQMELIIGDFLDDSLLRKCVEGVDKVYHLITTTFPSTTQDSAVYDINTNLVPTIRLVEECLKGKVKTLVYASSGGTIYGEQGSKGISESTDLNPISLYGQTKGAIESYLRFYSRVTSLNVKILRISNPYGPQQKPFGVQGLVATVIQCLLQNKELSVYGDMKTVRDYIYIEDVIEALVRISESKGPDVVNISSGEGRSILEVIKIIEKVSKRKVLLKKIPKRVQDVKSNILNPELAWKSYHWKANVDFEEGIRKTWNWYLKSAPSLR